MKKYQHQAIDKRVIKTYDLNDSVVLSTLVSGQVVLKGASVGCDIATLSGLQVVGHAGVVKEDGSSGPNVETHVAAGAKRESQR